MIVGGSVSISKQGINFRLRYLIVTRLLAIQSYWQLQHHSNLKQCWRKHCFHTCSVEDFHPHLATFDITSLKTGPRNEGNDMENPATVQQLDPKKQPKKICLVLVGPFARVQ